MMAGNDANTFINIFCSFRMEEAEDGIAVVGIGCNFPGGGKNSGAVLFVVAFSASCSKVDDIRFMSI